MEGTADRNLVPGELKLAPGRANNGNVGVPGNIRLWSRGKPLPQAGFSARPLPVETAGNNRLKRGDEAFCLTERRRIVFRDRLAFFYRVRPLPTAEYGHAVKHRTVGDAPPEAACLPQRRFDHEMGQIVRQFTHEPITRNAQRYTIAAFNGRGVAVCIDPGYGDTHVQSARANVAP
jgi:hypothetical protein